MAAEGGILLLKADGRCDVSGKGPREPLLEAGSSGWGQNCVKDSFLLFLPDSTRPGHSLVPTQ